VTTVVVAPGEAGETAAAALSEGGIEVERVATVADARAHVDGAGAVVVGDLVEGAVADLAAAVPDDVPVVGLGESRDAEWTVARPVEPAELTRTVRLAERTCAYRAAVEELYRHCHRRAAAELDDDDVPDEVDREVTDARRRAERAFRDARRLAGRAPYDRLLGPFPTGSEPEFAELTTGFEGDSEDAPADEVDDPSNGAGDDVTGPH
jgi:hypothetical protein